MNTFEKATDAYILKNSNSALSVAYAKKLPNFYCIRPGFEGLWGYTKELNVHTFFLDLTPRNVPKKKHKSQVVAVFFAEKIGMLFETDEEIVEMAKKLLTLPIIKKALDYYITYEKVLELSPKDLGVIEKESHS